jgi:hypothetical protein
MSWKKLRRNDSARRTIDAAVSNAVESLEGRQLLSAAFVEAGGRLVVRGTDGNDKITVTRDPSNAAEVRVTLNDQAFDFAASSVKQVYVEAGKGNDWVEADTRYGSLDAGMFFLGAQGSDTLISNAGDDALLGGGEADVVIAKVGNNYVNGGAGNDKIFGGSGDDTLVAEGGSDYLADAGGRNTISSDPKTDTVVTSALPTTVPSATGANPPVVSLPVTTPTPTPAIVTPPPTNPNPAPTPTVSTNNPFVIGVWSQPAWSFAKWKARGINTAVGYESLSGTVSVEKFSAEAVKNGLYMIRHPNADPSKDIGQKNLLAWMLNDEPDFHNTPAATVQSAYNRLKSYSKDIPVFVNFSGASALWGYGGKFQADYQAWMKGADWIGNDLYPLNSHNRPTALDAPGKAVERLAQWSGGKRQIAVIEASDQNLSGLEGNPGPSGDQLRAEVFNAVISGATGIVYFPQKIGGGFNFDAMNPAVEAEMKSVNGRLARIGDALMTTPNPAGVDVDVDGALRVTWRKYNGKTYVVVLNNSTQAVAARMDVSGVSGSSAAVDGENRSVAIKNGQIADSFKPYEAHVYVI